MNILITGINGFVGKYLLKGLKTYFCNEEVRIYGTYFDSRYIDEFNDVELFFMDLRNKNQVYDIITNVSPDLVFHLAAQSSVSVSWKNPNLTFDVNVNGTINLLDAIKEVNKNCRVLIVGSSDEYGKVKTIPVDESHPLNPQNLYAVSKVTQEMIGKLYVNAFDMKIIMTRSFNHIGPMQESIFVVSDWAKQIAEIELGKREPIIYVGNLDIKRDFTDVRDVVLAYMDLSKVGTPGEIYNVGTGYALELSYLLETLLSFSRFKIDVKIDENKLRPIENEIIQCDYNKLYNLCSWKPKYDIKNTLLEVLNYWRNIIYNDIR